MLSKQRNHLFIHKRGDLRLYLTKCLPIFQSFVKAAKHIHHTELGTMVCIDFFKKVLQKYYLLFALSGFGATTVYRE